MPSPPILASEKPLKLCPEVYLGSIEALKASAIEISWVENIYSTENLLHCTATSTQKKKKGDIAGFTLFPSGINL